jgi:multidrug efflux system membrane fusion protein
MVDPATGTVMLKARFPNHEQRLWPGEYLPVSMVLTVQSDAVVVPETAIQPGQNGTFVYVVKNGAAHVRPVKVARQRNALAVIAKGLKLGEAVVTQVPRNLRDGLAVQARTVEG